MSPFSFVFAIVIGVSALGAVTPAVGRDSVVATGVEHRKEDPVRANYLVTVADDFVVDIYHNGIKVPDDKRQLLEERFGATAERINIEVRRGDWLVFHVANNRLRWGGVKYFAAAGCFGRDEFGFVSGLSGDWSACDLPQAADRFIQKPRYLRHQAVTAIANPWAEGTPMMHAHAGPAWDGVPIWGGDSSTWLKVIVE